MATGREARMQERMRGAQRHQVQDASFDLFFDLPSNLDAAADAAAAPAPSDAAPADTTGNSPSPKRTSPQAAKNGNTTPKAAKRRRANGAGDDASKTNKKKPRTVTPPRDTGTRPGQEEVAESPLHAPGSGRRRSVMAQPPAAEAADAVVPATDVVVPVSPLPPKRTVRNESVASDHNDNDDDGPATRRNDEPSPELSTMVDIVLPDDSPAGTAGLGIHAAQSTTAKRKQGDADELSSPAQPVLAPVDNLKRNVVLPSSSPLARKSLAGSLAPALDVVSETPLASKNKGQTDDLDELSPDQPKDRPAHPKAAHVRQTSEVPSSSPVSRPAKRMPPRTKPRTAIATVEEEPEPEHDAEPEEAEEIGDDEAARALGRKRPRPRPSTGHEPSPELGSQPTESQAAVSPDDSRPAKKRRRQRDDEGTQKQTSPAAQSHPRPKNKPKTSRKQKQKQKQTDDDDELEGVGSGRSIVVTVQRFARVSTVSSGPAGAGAAPADDDDGDELAGAALPFCNRSSVSAVDVLAQTCEQALAHRLDQLHAKHQQARDAAAAADADGDEETAAAAHATRKDLVVARRAIESFQQELRTRLLDHAVAADALHALRKRVRSAHKAKLALRSEILRVRAERDQVALRTDALRAQHQQRVRDAMAAAQLSAALHDTDLAVAQGRAAVALPPAQQKAAELANLELAVRRIVAQVSGGSPTPSPAGLDDDDTPVSGGTLHQINEFNAFLERTAAVLEGRRLPKPA